MTDLKAEVLRVVEKWNQAFEENNVDRYFESVHEDITVFTPSNPYRIDGYEADRREFEISLKKGSTRCGLFQMLQPKIQIFGDTAIVTYYQRGMYGPQGSEKLVHLKETNVLVRDGAKWKAVHVHVSPTSH